MGKLTSLLLFALISSTQAGPRIDCLPEPNGNQGACEARGCIWKEDDSGIGAPWCYFKDGVGYKLDSQQGSTYNLRKNSGPSNPWGADSTEIQLTTKKIGSVLNVHIGIGGRYEPPVDFPRETQPSDESLVLSTDSSSDVFSFSVVRQSSNRKLFDTSLGGLIFSDQFIQIATYLPSENMYGWGENTHQTLRHDFTKYLTWAMFARDQPPNSGNLDTMNLYGVHPYYMILEPDGKAHGVLILNSNAQEVMTAPGPSLIYRTIGGNLDMYFFPGPTPELVTQQYLKFIGKPFLPAYWALGYQLSRYGYKGLDEMKTRIQAVRDAGIPIDIGVADIDYMQRYKDFTTGDDWSGFGDYVKTMHSWGMKLILIFDPAIEATYDSFKRGMAANAKYVGSDVCGFIGTTTEELCLRWQQMGAFHSFFRNHNTIGAPAQDPAVWPSVAAATKQANLFRYQYLPYLFSLHFVASQSGASVIRPVFFEFPTDAETFNLGYQFMWGPRMMVAPVIYQGHTTQNVYLPTDTWYSLFDYKYGSIISPGYATVQAPTTSRIPVFVRGTVEIGRRITVVVSERYERLERLGQSVIPRQTPSTTTTATRQNPFELLIAPCSMGKGFGTLYWDDGETIVNDFNSHDYHQFDFIYNTTTTGGLLTINHSKKSSTISLPTLDIIEIFNYPKAPNFRSFTVNGKTVNINVQKSTYSGVTKTLYISTPGLIDLTSADSIVIQWSNAGSSMFEMNVADPGKMKALNTNRYEELYF
ncbi:hypothetical protein CAEBREN_12391 [Caenorhabditis brenneri]|uniref:P-type domain-containing protein n=1 Tax=Caenorhabditis brenneri TaxID=135651 RepID=G0PE40_CAEBE|nr:hypothetical protein CAEBREN_12391 [Caenorhabditis brenneri]